MFRFFLLLFIFLPSFLVQSQDYQLSNSKTIKAVLEAQALLKFPEDYLRQKTYIFDQYQAYRDVLRYKRTSDYQVILYNAINKFYPDFFKILKEYELNVKKYKKSKAKQKETLSSIE